MAIPNQGRLTCIECGQTKTLNEFYGKPGLRWKHRPRCRECIQSGIEKAQQEMRVCTKCHQTKKGSDFYVRKLVPSGNYVLARECKACYRVRARKHRDVDRERYLKQQHVYGQRRHEFLRNVVFEHYGGWKCACCGETEPKFLTLDHINNDGAAFRRKIAGKQEKGGGFRTYQWLYTNGLPPGYQVLCANCNYGKRMNKGICPHTVRRNDHPETGVGPSGPKRSTPRSKKRGDDMVSSARKLVAAQMHFWAELD